MSRQTVNHRIPKARVDLSYPYDYEFLVMESPEEAIQYLNKMEGVVAVDIETTGLNHTQAKLVGISLSCWDRAGLYIPIGHLEGPNIPWVTIQSFFQKVVDTCKVVMFNKRFDMRFLERYGIKFKTVIDVQIMVWLADVNFPMPSLKWAEKHFLGWEREDFQSLFGNSLALAPTEEVAPYAISDAISTRLLYFHMYPLIAEQKRIFQIDNLSVDIIKEVEETPFYAESKHLEILGEAFDAKIKQLEKEAHKIAGRSFNLGSSQQTQEVLQSLGINLPDKTKKGNYSTSASTLNKIKHPLTKCIVNYRTAMTFKNSYIDKLKKEIETRKGLLYINHKVCAAPSGRLATGASAKNPYFSNLNIMSIPKPSKSKFMIKSQGDGFDLDSYELIDYDPELDYPVIKGRRLNDNVRHAFIAKDPYYPDKQYYWVSIDYDQEELRVAGIVTGEPNIVQPFKQGTDLIDKTTEAVFGENWTDEQRQITKVLVYGLMYGGTAYTIANSLNIPLNEAEEYVTNYVHSHPVLYRVKDLLVQKAMRLGYTETLYGRRRYLKNYFADKSLYGYGCRSVMSHIIQGTCADIFRMMLIKFKRRFADEFKHGVLRWRVLLHDEFNFLVEKQYVNDLVPALVECMTIQESSWPYPLTASPSIGTSWGNIYDLV